MTTLPVGVTVMNSASYCTAEKARVPKKKSARSRVIMGGEHVEGHRARRDAAFVEAPREWADALRSLIKISDEYREAGLLVANVGPGSRAATAGIMRGDVLLRYDGTPLDKADMLSRLAADETREPVTVEAVRGADEMTFKVPAGRLGVTVSALLYRSSPQPRLRSRKFPARRSREPISV
jgi:S1-C subfamily serine protease